MQTTQPIRMQGQQKILPPAGEEGHSSNENAWQQYHMQQKQSEWKLSRHTPTQPISIQPLQTKQNYVLLKHDTMMKNNSCS